MDNPAFPSFSALFAPSKAAARDGAAARSTSALRWAPRTWLCRESPLSPTVLLQEGTQWRLGELLPLPLKPSLPRQALLSLCPLLLWAGDRREGGREAPGWALPSWLHRKASLSHLCFDVAMVIAER